MSQTIQLRRLARAEYPVEPGLYLWQRGINEELIGLWPNGIINVDGKIFLMRHELPDGIAWSERIECEVVG